MYDERYHQEFTEEELTNEVWKDIPDFEGYYQASNIGRIRSVDRYVNDRWGNKRLLKGQIIKPQFDKDGYLRLNLNKQCKKIPKRINRIVAEAFIPNPNNLPQVNHKDENKLNNRVSNLEWCSVMYNNLYGSRKVPRVNMYTLEGKLLNTFNSIREAARSIGKETSKRAISQCCKYGRENAFGYKWSYADE